MQKGGLSRSSAAAVHTRHIKGWAPPRAKREDPTFGGAHTPLGRGKNTLRSASRGPPSSLPQSAGGSPPQRTWDFVSAGGGEPAAGGACTCWAPPASVAQVQPVHLGLPRVSARTRPRPSACPLPGLHGGHPMTPEGCASQSACSHATPCRATPLGHHRQRHPRVTDGSQQ